jgi:hypothetical protein
MLKLISIVLKTITDISYSEQTSFSHWNLEFICYLDIVIWCFKTRCWILDI